MNYEEPRQRKSDKRWDWTNRRDQQTWAIGYCAGWHDWTDEQAARVGDTREHLQARKEKDDGQFRSKFHTDGHETPDDATACYYGFLMDHLHEARLAGTKKICEYPGCEEWTSGALEVPMLVGPVMLCLTHRSPEGMRTVLPLEKFGPIMHS